MRPELARRPGALRDLAWWRAWDARSDPEPRSPERNSEPKAKTNKDLLINCSCRHQQPWGQRARSLCHAP